MRSVPRVGLSLFARCTALLALTESTRAVVLSFEEGPNSGQAYTGQVEMHFQKYAVETLYPPQIVGSELGVTNNPALGVVLMDAVAGLTQAASARTTGNFGNFLEDRWGIVRVTEIIDLFNKAQASGDGGPNQGDGGYSLASSALGGGGTGRSLKVILTPPAAAVSGQWQIGTSLPLYASGTTVPGLPLSIANVSVTSVTGFLPPIGTPRAVGLSAGFLTTVTAEYNGFTTQPANRSVTAFNSTSFNVNTSGAPTSFRWRKNGSDLANGLNANGTTLTGADSRQLNLVNAKAADAGNYSVRVTWALPLPNNFLTSNSTALTITPAAQTIAFDPLPDRVLDDGPFALSATANSGLLVTYQVISGPATVSGSTVTPTGIGPVTIRATRSGTPDYAAAPPVDRSFLITGDNFNTWRNRYFSAAELSSMAISGPTADFDRDGAVHLLEFALNLHPKTSDATPMTPGTGTRGLPAVRSQLVSGQRRLVLEYVRRKGASAPGISYQVEFTGNLANAASWSVTASGTAITSIDSVWERVVVTDSQPANPGRFGRLVVTLP